MPNIDAAGRVENMLLKTPLLPVVPLAPLATSMDYKTVRYAFMTELIRVLLARNMALYLF